MGLAVKFSPVQILTNLEINHSLDSDLTEVWQPKKLKRGKFQDNAEHWISNISE